MALGKPLAIGAEDHGHVAKLGQRRTERTEDVDLAGRVVHMVVAADDVRDAHVEIVDHHAEVVRRHAVGSQEHEVVELAVRELDGSLHQVVPGDAALFRRAKAHHRLPARRRHEAARFRALGPPASVVLRLLAARRLLLAQRFELLARHVVVISVAGADQLVGHLPVACEALHLEERALVPVDAEPTQAVDDRLDRSLRRALEIRVLDAQDELPAVMARVGPREKRGARAADMQIAGWARREPGANSHG